MTQAVGITLGVLALVVALLPPPLGLPGMRALGGPLHAWSLYVIAGAALAWILGPIVRTCWPLAALIVWMAIRTAQLGATARSLEVLGWTLAWALGVVLLHRWSTHTVETLMWVTLLAVGLVQAVLGVINLFGVYPLLWVKAASHAHRPTGLLVNPNHWGLYLAFCLPILDRIAAGIERTAPRAGRWHLRWVVLGAWTALIVLSYSAAAVAGALAVLAVLIGQRIPNGERPMLGSILLISVAAVVLARPHEDLLGGRAPYWRFLIDGWWSGAPWTGYGPGTWLAMALHPEGPIVRGVPGYFEAQNKEAAVWDTPHSEALQLAFELGVVGLAIGAALLAWVAYHAVLAWRDGRPGSRLAVLVLLVAGVALWWTPVFHRGPLAIPVLVALAYLRRPA